MVSPPFIYPTQLYNDAMIYFVTNHSSCYKYKAVFKVVYGQSELNIRLTNIKNYDRIKIGPLQFQMNLQFYRFSFDDRDGP